MAKVFEAHPQTQPQQAALKADEQKATDQSAEDRARDARAGRQAQGSADASFDDPTLAAIPDARQSAPTARRPRQELQAKQAEGQQLMAKTQGEMQQREQKLRAPDLRRHRQGGRATSHAARAARSCTTAAAGLRGPGVRHHERSDRRDRQVGKSAAPKPAPRYVAGERQPRPDCGGDRSASISRPSAGRCGTSASTANPRRGPAAATTSAPSGTRAPGAASRS